MKRDNEKLKEVLVFLENQLDRTNNWVNFAEAKNAAALAVDGAFIIGLMAMFDKTPVVCCVMGCILLIALIVGFISFRPNMSKIARNRQINQSSDSPNLIFFGDVAKIKDSSEYLKLLQKEYYPDVEYSDIVKLQCARDFADEIITNSRIACDKYDCFALIVRINILSFMINIVMLCVA